MKQPGMRSRVSLAAICAGLLCPSLALAAEGGGEESGSWLVLVFYATNFGLFVWIVFRYAAPLARKFFIDRASGIRAMLQSAERAVGDAQELYDRAAGLLRELGAEKSRLAKELEEETAYLLRRIGESAREGAARIGHDAELTAAASVEAARLRVRARLAAAAGKLARGLIEREMSPTDQARLLQDFQTRLSQDSAAKVGQEGSA